MNTFTTQDMNEFANYVALSRLHNIAPSLEHWYAEKNKPTKKVIDLSVLIDRQIDCTHDLIEGYGPLDDSWTEAALCEARVVPRTKYIHAWQGGECPLPEGFMVKVWCRDMRKALSGNRATEFNWTYDSDSREDIIAFEVLGVADGYVMPWEVSDVLYNTSDNAN